MPSQADAVIATELQPGEEMLWCAQPGGTSRFFIRIALVVLCIVAAIGVHGITDTLAFRLAMPFGLKPGSAALWALAAVILVDSILYGAYLVNTYYGLTNRRVIIVPTCRATAYMILRWPIFAAQSSASCVWALPSKFTAVHRGHFSATT